MLYYAWPQNYIRLIDVQITCYNHNWLVTTQHRVNSGLWVVLTSFLLIFASNSLATADKVTIVSSVIPNLISDQEEQKGLYNHFLEALPEQKLIFMPAARIEIEFDKHYIDCIFPASSKGMDKKFDLIESEPIQQTSAFVYSLSNEWKTKKYPVIGIYRGFDYGNVRDVLSARYVELPSDLEAAKMLNSGKVDAMIGYSSDVAAAFTLSNSAMPNFDKNQPLYTQKDAMVCHRNARNKVFVDEVNSLIKQWRKTGMLAH